MQAGFAKFWKKIFLSEASIAVVQDLFWWCFMRIFKPNTQIEQDRVFDRVADSFAALFFSINPDIRDKIFKVWCHIIISLVCYIYLYAALLLLMLNAILQVYPNVLSQAIFMIFFDAFPESHRMYGPMFKEELVAYCWELTTGNDEFF